jgi:signal transduction histidine kinase
MVKSSANHLLALINDVIDVTKIEAEKIQLTIEPFDLARLINEVKESFAPALKEKGLALKLDQPDKSMIRSDERRVRQVIMNLVSNAVKFTDKGEIGIRVTGNGERAAVSVKDTGVGIKAEDMGKLFKQFSRIIVPGQPLREGTGLGLFLSQKLASILGGEIKAASEFSKGSEFTLTLPIEHKGV